MKFQGTKKVATLAFFSISFLAFGQLNSSAVIESLLATGHRGQGHWEYGDHLVETLNKNSRYFALGIVESVDEPQSFRNLHILTGLRRQQINEILAFFSVITAAEISQLKTAQAFYPTTTEIPKPPYVITSFIPFREFILAKEVGHVTFLLVGTSGNFQFEVSQPDPITELSFGSTTIPVKVQRVKMSFKARMAAPLSTIAVNAFGSLDVPVWTPKKGCETQWNRLVVDPLLGRKPRLEH